MHPGLLSLFANYILSVSDDARHASSCDDLKSILLISLHIFSSPRYPLL